jgi:phosphoserine phosphatase RsbU/P
MRIEDGSDNVRIDSLTKMTEALVTARSPWETLQIIRRGMWDTYGPSGSMMISTRGLAEGEYRVSLLQLPGDPNLKQFDPWAVDKLPVWRGGILAEIIRQRKPQIFQEVDWSGDPNLSQRLTGYESVMAMPMMAARLPVSWVMLLKKKPDFWTPDDMEQSMLRTAIIGTLLESQTIAGDLEIANERIDGEIKQLAHVQRSLLPDPLPDIPGLQIAVSYEPSGRAGGDLYDFFPLHATKGKETSTLWCIFIGDASGHGAAAAVVMAIVQAILQAHPKEAKLASELLTHANRHLCHKKLGGFVTAFLGIYDPSTRELSYASAGHPAPIVKSDDVLFQLNEVLSYPLGIDKTNRFRDATIQLHPGNTILMYTDGITEARSPEGDMFDIDRLETALKSAGDGPEKLIAQVRQQVCAFQRARSQVDDQTMVAVKCV